MSWMPHACQCHTRPKCAKCGSGDTITRFFPEGATVDSVWVGGTRANIRCGNPPECVRTTVNDFIAERDILRQLCRSCGWWWTDLPLDAIPEDPTP